MNSQVRNIPRLGWILRQNSQIRSSAQNSADRGKLWALAITWLNMTCCLIPEAAVVRRHRRRLRLKSKPVAKPNDPNKLQLFPFISRRRFRRRYRCRCRCRYRHHRHRRRHLFHGFNNWMTIIIWVTVRQGMRSRLNWRNFVLAFLSDTIFLCLNRHHSFSVAVQLLSSAKVLAVSFFQWVKTYVNLTAFLQYQ